MYKIVLIRHGESEWNKKNLFAGWSDIDLTSSGVDQAKEAGVFLKKKKFSFDLCFTSLLKRAIKTSSFILEEMDLMWIPVVKDWRLNERHYGDFQGKNRKDIAKKVGEEQLLLYRRSYNVRPPEIKGKELMKQKNDPRYSFFKKQILSEALKDVVKRVVPFWEKDIIPNIKTGKKILITASGNSIRALTKHLNNMNEAEILKITIPYAVPIVYELDKNFQVIKWYYLGDPKKIKKITEEIKNQGKAK